ncbi:mRNA splicing protein [Hanseniaspora vineae]
MSHTAYRDLSNVSRSELTANELKKLEKYEFQHGPLSLLNEAQVSKTPVIISLRNNHKIIARVKAFDKHCNMVLENVKELWSEKHHKNSKLIPRERFISKLFLRGDSVIIVLKAPSN